MLLVAKESFHGTALGRSFYLPKGALVDDQHPIAQENRDMFRKATSDVPPWNVEEMTANPGEARHVEPSFPSGDGLEEKSLSNLQFIAAKAKISTSGSKADLVERIRKHRQEHPEEA